MLDEIGDILIRLITFIVLSVGIGGISSIIVMLLGFNFDLGTILAGTLSSMLTFIVLVWGAKQDE